MRSSNCPFAYILLFVFGLLIGSDDVGLGNTGDAVTELDREARNEHPSTMPTPILDYQLHQPTGTCAYLPAVERHRSSAPGKPLLMREEALDLYFSLSDNPTSSDSDRDTDEDFALEHAPRDSDDQCSEAGAAESTRKPQKRKATFSRKKTKQSKVPRICNEAEVEKEEVGA
ncbi:hypothetical protein MRX96_007651 [Rhipicephalus microplus]